MSASNKKKLRKEESAAIMTEKQQEAQKETKKLKLYTTIFTVVIAAVLVAALAIAGSSLIERSGFAQKRTTAAVVDGQEMNTVSLSYYYHDAINSAFSKWQEQYGNDVAMYLKLMGLDVSKPLSSQPHPEGKGTWADYFVDQAVESLKSDTAMVKEANKAGYKITEEEQKLLDSNFEQLKSMVTVYGFKDFSDYLAANYGPGCSEETYKEYTSRSALATSFVKNHMDGLTYDKAAVEKHDKDHAGEFASYTFNDYFVAGATYAEGGKEDENGSMVYTPEQKEAGLKKAKEAADKLIAAKTPEEFDKAIAAMDSNKDKKDAASTKNTDVLYSNISEVVQKWIKDPARKNGDTTVIPYETSTYNAGGEDTVEVVGYYAVFFQSRNDNERKLANVRHILASFEGGTPDANGNMTYSDAEKAAAKKEADDLLNSWKSGAATEDSFAALAKEKTDDKGSAETGGMIENISAASPLVPEFLKWSIDNNRKAGDTAVVESPYGYHVMYYSADGEETYKDSMIRNTMRADDMEKWYDSVLETVSAEKKDTSKLDLDFVIRPPQMG